MYEYMCILLLYYHIGAFVFQVSDKELVSSQASEHKGASKGMALIDLYGTILI